jgi:hypothetical protein
MFHVSSGTVTIIDEDGDGSGICESITGATATDIEILSLSNQISVYDDFPPSVLDSNLRDVSAILSCVNVTDIDLSGVSMNLPLIAALAVSCLRLRHLNLRALADPDDGTSLLALASSRSLETLNVSCWEELCDDSVVEVVSGCRSLRSMVVSHCATLSITPDMAASLRFPQAPFRFLADPGCTPRCLPPNRKCALCLVSQIEGDAAFAAQLGLTV